MMEMDQLPGDDIADVVLTQFEHLPTKRKPQIRGDGIREWVPLSGIVARRGGNDNLTCLAIATGMKCLPQGKIPQAQGVVLHDWHAEVLAIRSFNRFLLEECYALARSKEQCSEYVRLRTPDERTEEHFQPFALNDGIDLHMYCSEAPCGDASMELTMAAQEDSSPWAVSSSPSSTATSDAPTALHGRGYFSELGIVRRKPSRPDAPPTLSKSCSDKITLKQSTSLLSSLTSLLIDPSNVYLSTLTLPSSQFSPTACNRAFSASGRLKPLQDSLDADTIQWKGGYRFTPFQIRITEREFRYSRRGVDKTATLVPSNIAASWIGNGKEETIINGTLQGRKQFDIRGASRMCKRRMWKLALEIAELTSAQSVQRCLSISETYGHLKEDDVLEERRRVEDDVKRLALKGWVRNGGEDYDIGGVEA